MISRLINVASCLWVMLGVTVTAGALFAESSPVAIADLAREKDIVWLSLVTAIVAIGFSAWLVRQMLVQQQKTLDAISQLRVELHERPCALRKDS